MPEAVTQRHQKPANHSRSSLFLNSAAIQVHGIPMFLRCFKCTRNHIDLSPWFLGFLIQHQQIEPDLGMLAEEYSCLIFGDRRVVGFLVELSFGLGDLLHVFRLS